MGGKFSRKEEKRELEKGVINSIENENFTGPLPEIAILPIKQPILQYMCAVNKTNPTFFILISPYQCNQTSRVKINSMNVEH